MAKLKKDYFISDFLDKRHQKSNGKYPVKLRVYHTSNPPKQKLYSTAFDFTEQEFKIIKNNKRLNAEQLKIKRTLLEIVEAAHQIAEKLPVFNFNDFERLLFNDKGSNQMNVNYYYKKAIEEYTKNKQLGTASNYDLSLKSLLAYHSKDQLAFETITPQWLKDYQEYMLNTLKRSATTVGIYLRPLRAIFNTAIFDKTIPADIYPFGKRKYSIPAPKKVKKALSKEQLKQLWDAEPPTHDQQKAKDFWFFQFFCNGINPKDILLLKNKDIVDDKITFNRAKTARTNQEQSMITIFLNDHAKAILHKHRASGLDSNAYIFSVFDCNSSETEKHRLTQNFIRFINQHFNKFATSIGIQEQISCQWARHTFATTAIRSGFSMEMVSEALAHTSLKPTQGYFAGFEDEKKKEIANKLMDF